MKTRKFLDALVADGVHVFASLGHVEFSGPEDRVAEAREAMNAFPSLGGEIIRLLNPSPEDRREWLDSQGENVRREYRERVDRLRKAGVAEAEGVALSTTHHDHNSMLPEHMKPIRKIRGMEESG